jgi:uncharacterized flavoprotein (TIGR03862 family)
MSVLGSRPHIVIIGGGAAGLIAADHLSSHGDAVSIALYERMPSLGRKVLMAGRGGLNLTHSETLDRFLPRYGAATERLRPIIQAFPPRALRDWAHELGQGTFVGSSGRVFPKAMKTSPLLRALITRLQARGVAIHTKRSWRGWDGDALLIDDERVHADAVILALGGASWAKLGSDGAWATILQARGVQLSPFQPSNCGFEIAWSEHMRARFAGAALKNIRVRVKDEIVRGEATISAYGLEGGAIYALSVEARVRIAERGEVVFHINLRPDLSAAQIVAKLSKARRGDSLSNILRKSLNFSPQAVALLREAHGLDLPRDPEALAACIINAPLRSCAAAPIDRAISTAGGIVWDELDDHLMLKRLPGVFASGEMLDWEAPTGGYLLQASFATGVAAAKGALAFVQKP